MSNKLFYPKHIKNRVPGETYQPKVKVLKDYGGVPTSIEINGFVYALVHDDFVNGHKNKFANKSKKKKKG